MSDDDLFKAFARSSDPETSHDAAASVDEHIAKLEGEVATAIGLRGDLGATWDELHTLTGIDKASISPRFKPLRRKKQIEARTDSIGEVIKRPGRSGRGQIVWFPYSGKTDERIEAEDEPLLSGLQIGVTNE